MKSDVHCCLLDCTKVFNRVSFKTLFVKLLKTAISAVLLRCLVFTYTCSHLQAFTLRKNVSRDKFVILNGVRQGSLLSPILFGYNIELINVIVKRNIGSKVGDHFTDILVYADDIVLLAQLMVDMCSSNAGEHNHMLAMVNILVIPCTLVLGIMIYKLKG